MSTAEAEYVSLFACCAQVIWMRTQLIDYGYKYNRIPLYYDSKSAIGISCNPVQHSKTKHIDIRYNFIKEHVEKGTVEIYFVGTEYQLANLFTKALPKERFEYLDELCPPNKRYDLMDANKKVDLEHVQCPPKSKILTNIIKSHPLRVTPPFLHIAAEANLGEITVVTLVRDRCPRGKVEGVDTLGGCHGYCGRKRGVVALILAMGRLKQARGAKDALDYVLDCTVKDLCASCFGKSISSMSNSEDSTVTYTEIPNPYEDPSDMGSPGVEGPIFQDPPSSDYVPGPEEPEQAPPSPFYVPFVPEPVYN
ncbi:hypothetical protein Tco_1282824 [Tanacetum coccineum]